MAPRLFQDPYHEGAAALQVLATVVVPVQRHRNEPRSGGQLGELAPGYQGEPHGQDVLSAEVVRGVEEFVELDPIYHAGTFTERLEARDDEETAIGSGEGAVQPERAVGRPDSDGRVVERADQAPPFFETTVCGPQRELLVALRDQLGERVEGDQRQVELSLAQVELPNVRAQHLRLKLACAQSFL